VSTSTADKINAIASVTGVVLGAGALVADHYATLPDWFGTAGALVIGGALAHGAWRSLSPASHSTLLHRLVIGLLAALTGVVAVLVWPGPKPTQADAKPSGDPTKGIDVTKVGDTVPGPDTEKIKACIAVSGVGKMPKGYQLWVANNFDIDGEADPANLYNLQRVVQTTGQATWHTPVFGVGEGQKHKGTYFWIHVFLLPRSSDTVLQNLLGDAPGFKETLPGTKPIESIRVQSTGVWNCPYPPAKKEKS
jgi:hypothetical protein